MGGECLFFSNAVSFLSLASCPFLSLEWTLIILWQVQDCRTCIGSYSCLGILPEKGMHSYHLQRVQVMIPNNYLPHLISILLVGTYSRLEPIKPSLQMFDSLMRLPLHCWICLASKILIHGLMITYIAQ